MDLKDIHEELGLPPMAPVHSSDEIARWNEQVAAFKASRHSEPREPDGEPYADTGWAKPRARPSERLVLGIYGSHFLFEVIDPPGWGFRLVNLVVDGCALTWEMPGYGKREAEKISTLLVDDYL
jgi:hypothetical protein